MSERHEGVINHVKRNLSQEGDCVMFSLSQETVAMVGTVDSAALTDFFETMFRAAPPLKSVVKEALEQSEWPLS